jgi:hypothetical protein
VKRDAEKTVSLLTEDAVFRRVSGIVKSRFETLELTSWQMEQSSDRTNYLGLVSSYKSEQPIVFSESLH